VLEGRWRGGNTLHRPGLSPLFFAYKNRGGEKREAKRTQEKGDRDKRAEKVGETESEKKTKRERRRIEEKNRKQREIGKTGEEPVKTVIAGTVSATASHRR
jgi:hypothetical protein